MGRVTWGLAGRKLSYGWAMALAYYVGFRDKELVKAVAVMRAESAFYCAAWHENVVDGEVTSTDHGLYQINDKWHPNFERRDWYSAIDNAEYAYKMSSGKYFKAWMAHESGAYKRYVPVVWATKVLGRWKKKVPRVENELGPRHAPTLPRR